MSKKCKYEPNVRRFVGEYTGFIKGFTVNSGPSCKFENINLNSLGAALRKADRKTIETNALSPAPREPFSSTKFDSGMSTVSPVSQQNYLRQHTSCKCEGLTIAITGRGVHTDNSRDSTPSFSGSSIYKQQVAAPYSAHRQYSQHQQPKCGCFNARGHSGMHSNQGFPHRH